MSATGVASVVVFSAHPVATVAFYRSVGVPLADEDHGEGEVHAAAEVGPVHVAVYPGSGPPTVAGWRDSGSTFVGFWVRSLEEARRAVGELGAPVLQDHQHLDWGCRIVVADPDGRPVELNQRDHCPPAP